MKRLHSLEAYQKVCCMLVVMVMMKKTRSIQVLTWYCRSKVM